MSVDVPHIEPNGGRSLQLACPARDALSSGIASAADPAGPSSPPPSVMASSSTPTKASQRPGSASDTSAASPSASATSHMPRKPNFRIDLPQQPSFQSQREPLARSDVSASSLSAYQGAPAFSPPLLTPPEDSLNLGFDLSALKVRGSPAGPSAGPADRQLRQSNQDKPATPTMEQPEITSPGGQPSAQTASVPDTSSEDAAIPLEDAIATAVSEIDVSHARNNYLQAVAQAVPIPLTDMGPDAPTAIHPLMEALTAKYPGFVRLEHVITTPAAPASPLFTPGALPTTSGDYFGALARVFSNFSFVPNPYAVHPATPAAPPAPTAPTASSPALALPPAAAEVALYERLIPPSTAREFADLFEPAAGASALAARLLELAPGGTLLAVYPTRAGARQFCAGYLHPVLDPVLRALLLAHGLSSHLGPELSRVPAVEHLLPFPQLAARLNSLLRKLNPRDVGAAGAAPAARFELARATRARATPGRAAWEAAWRAQEAPRIKAALARYWAEGRSLPDDEHLSAAALARAVLEGVRRRGYAPGEARGEGDGIEVGVFVVRRRP